MIFRIMMFYQFGMFNVVRIQIYYIDFLINYNGKMIFTENVLFVVNYANIIAESHIFKV
jgi:hypothetical protein